MLTLKQARRMVAKSRRRVWRLARQRGVAITGYDRLLPDTAAHLTALAMSSMLFRGADVLLREYQARRARLTTLELGQHRERFEAFIAKLEWAEDL